MFSLKLAMFNVFAIAFAIASFCAVFRYTWLVDAPLIAYQLLFATFVLVIAIRACYNRDDSRPFAVGCILALGALFLVNWYGPNWMILDLSQDTLDKITRAMTPQDISRNWRESVTIAQKAVSILELCLYLQFSLAGGLLAQHNVKYQKAGLPDIPAA